MILDKNDYYSLPAFWIITDFGDKCEKCTTTNTITLEQSEPKKGGIV
jgi:hypothetical protein